MYALVSPNEPKFEGYRVAEVAVSPFEVAEPLFWVECGDEVMADMFYYDPNSGVILPNPSTVVPVDQQPTTTGSQSF